MFPALKPNVQNPLAVKLSIHSKPLQITPLSWQNYTVDLEVGWVFVLLVV
jgi:hypothetical protein